MSSSESPAPRQAGNLRKAEFREYTEVSLHDGGRHGFNDSYRNADLNFTQFLIPPGKRVLELGCGRGDLLASLKPS
jgi:cyclopropane fatty-acyl-phospholipid synthase-like methyltransferase